MHSCFFFYLRCPRFNNLIISTIHVYFYRISVLLQFSFLFIFFSMSHRWKGLPPSSSFHSLVLCLQNYPRIVLQTIFPFFSPNFTLPNMRLSSSPLPTTFVFSLFPVTNKPTPKPNPTKHPFAPPPLLCPPSPASCPNLLHLSFLLSLPISQPRSDNFKKINNCNFRCARKTRMCQVFFCYFLFSSYGFFLASNVCA